LAELSLTDKLRVHISEKLGQSFDFSLSSNRSNDRKQFIENHNKDLPKEKHLNEGSVRTSYERILEQQMKAKGIDPATLGKKPKHKKFNSDMNAKITPKPQAGQVEKKPQIGKDGRPIIATQQTGQVIQPETFDEKAVSSTINGMWLVVKSALPDLELLSEDEKVSLGALFKPMFNRYLSNDRMLLIIPFIAAAGIFLPKLAKAKNMKKERKAAETIQDTSKQTKDTPPNQDTNTPTQEKSDTYYSNFPQINKTVKTKDVKKDEKKSGGALPK